MTMLEKINLNNYSWRGRFKIYSNFIFDNIKSLLDCEIHKKNLYAYEYMDEFAFLKGYALDIFELIKHKGWIFTSHKKKSLAQIYCNNFGDFLITVYDKRLENKLEKIVEKGEEQFNSKADIKYEISI